MQSTIVILISKPGQIKSFNLTQIPDRFRKEAKFILIMSNLIDKSLISNLSNIIDEIYTVPIISIDNFQVYHIADELDSVMTTICKKYQNIKAFTTDEFNLELIERVLHKHNIITWMQNTAKTCRNKIIMKEHMQRFNIRVPKFMHYDGNNTFQYMSQHLGLPFVLKPVDGAASVGFYKINNANDYITFLAKYNKAAAYEAEEFIQGTLYHIDTVKYKNEYLTTIAEYMYPQAETLNGKLEGSLEILAIDARYKCLAEFNKQVVSSLNNDGCFHHEVFLTSSMTPIFLEIGWRKAGAPVDYVFTNHYGVSQALLYIMLSLGFSYAEIANSMVSRSGYIVPYWVPQSKGIFNGIKLPHLQGRAEVINLIDLGTEIKSGPGNMFDTCAYINIQYDNINGNYEQIKHDFYALKIADLVSQ